MPDDIVRQLGHLSLGTRFKRIGEALQAQAQAVLVAHDMDIPAGLFPLLAALGRLGELSVGDLSRAVGVSQPVVSRSLRALEAAGLIEAEALEADRRVRRIALSRAGRALVERAQQQAWPAIEAAVAEACAGLTGPLLDQLDGLEAALAQQPLAQRVAAQRALKTPRAAKRSPR